MPWRFSPLKIRSHRRIAVGAPHQGYTIGESFLFSSQQPRERVFVNLTVLVTEEDEADEADAPETFGFFGHCTQCDLGCLFLWIAEDAGRDSREGYRAYFMLLGEREGVAVAGGE